MTNFEKYKDEIAEFIDRNILFGLKDGKIMPCKDIGCTICEYGGHDIDCELYGIKWLYEEYREPQVDWDKVAVDTPLLVSDDGKKWFKRYFAEHKHELVYTFIAGKTSWSNDALSYCGWNYAKLAEVEDVK